MNCPMLTDIVLDLAIQGDLYTHDFPADAGTYFLGSQVPIHAKSVGPTYSVVHDAASLLQYDSVEPSIWYSKL